MTEWIDATTYSQGDRLRVPTAWRASLDSGIHVTVFRSRYYPDGWAFSVWWRGSPIADAHRTRLESLDEAKRHALEQLRMVLAEALAAVDDALVPAVTP